MTHRTYLGLGSNLGDGKRNLTLAIEDIERLIGTVVCQSAFYNTEPWGFDSDYMFTNAVVSVDTALSPHDLLTATQRIEQSMGRGEKSANGQYHDRIIDIDILTYDDLTINEPHLHIPHPLMQEREFVMKPLNEVLEKEKVKR